MEPDALAATVFHKVTDNSYGIYDGLIMSLDMALDLKGRAALRGLLLQLRGGATVVAPVGAGVSAAEVAREALDQYRVLFGTDAGVGQGACRVPMEVGAQAVRRPVRAIQEETRHLDGGALLALNREPDRLGGFGLRRGLAHTTRGTRK